MNKYSVTLNFPNREAFMYFIDHVGPEIEMRISVTPTDVAAAIHELHPAPKRGGAPRGPRGSKVNDAIRNALASGPKTTKELKEALGAAGMAAGSLSTGLAILQRSKTVERVDEGLYALKVAQAAE